MGSEPEVIGPKWDVRFRDLREWHVIEAKCFSGTSARSIPID
jgi:hypothetical protein